jgi:hypothetical protein
MTTPKVPCSVRRQPDTKLHTAVRRDVEAASGGSQVQLPLGQQVSFGGRFERSSGHAARAGNARAEWGAQLAL